MPETTDQSLDLRHFAEAYTAAWCSQNAASVAAFFAVDGALQVNDAAPAIGRTAITEVAQSFMTAFPDMQVFFDNLVEQEDRVFYHWTLTGTNTGPGGTGRELRVSGFEVWQMNTEGLIAQSLGHFDVEDYRQQLIEGVVKLGDDWGGTLPQDDDITFVVLKRKADTFTQQELT